MHGSDFFKMAELNISSCSQSSCVNMPPNQLCMVIHEFGGCGRSMAASDRNGLSTTPAGKETVGCWNG
jgi:hypothetical protein